MTFGTAVGKNIVIQEGNSLYICAYLEVVSARMLPILRTLSVSYEGSLHENSLQDGAQFLIFEPFLDISCSKRQAVVEEMSPVVDRARRMRFTWYFEGGCTIVEECFVKAIHINYGLLLSH